jgi:predicted Rossmann fold flavoprotein
MTSTPYLTGDIRIAVIGGGAAGFFAALNTAEKNPRARITIFEAAAKPLQKVLISGGGRCNVTHACFDPVRLTEFYPRGQKELRSLFARFQPRDTMTWFENRGLRLKTEPDGRVFPITDCSQDVIALFLDQAEKLRIRLRTQTRVESVRHQNGQFAITSQGKTEPFDVCILSTGYSPPGWKLAESLGHTIIPPVPSLFPFTVKDSVISGLQGISLPHVQGRLMVESPGKPQKLEAEGALLITHTGLSGPVIYRLSAWGARALAESRYQARLQLDLLPELEEEALRSRLQTLLMETEAKKKLENTHFPPLPNRLWLSLLLASGANLEVRSESVSKKTLNRLIENLKRLPLTVTGKSPSKEEFVSCGGVPLKEVDFKIMQSRRVPQLYFGGEILDIDGLTGGFNFQACWSEGWAISEALKAMHSEKS